MDPNRWILALHVIGLLSWVGSLLVLSRLLVFHIKQSPETQAALGVFERRLYFMGCVPGGVLVISTGLLMLHGVGQEALKTPGVALKWYFNPTLNGFPSFWYVTFHVKMVAVAMLLACDFYMYGQLRRMTGGRPAKTGWGLALIVGLATTLAATLAVWLPLGALDVPIPRVIGYGIGIPAGAATGAAVFRAGRKSGKAALGALHGTIALLVLLIVIVIVARPLANGVPL